MAPDPEAPPVLTLTIGTTTIVRAYAEKPGFESTNIDTQTYLFLDQVIGAPTMSTSHHRASRLGAANATTPCSRSPASPW